MDPGSWAVRLGPRCFSVESVDSFRISVVVAPPPLFTHQIKAEPYRCSRRVASIIERIELGCASNLGLVRLLLITAAQRRLNF